MVGLFLALAPDVCWTKGVVVSSDMVVETVMFSRMTSAPFPGVTVSIERTSLGDVGVISFVLESEKNSSFVVSFVTVVMTSIGWVSTQGKQTLRTLLKNRTTMVFGVDRCVPFWLKS